MAHRFNRIAARVSSAAGNDKTSLVALSFIVLWAATGPLFGFSNTWQMIINDATNIVAFLLLFVIQSTQVRSETAIQLKLNEVTLALDGARSDFIGLENRTEQELKEAALLVESELRNNNESRGHDRHAV